MATDDTSRPIAGTPITDASAVTAPTAPTTFGSNADLRVLDDEHLRDAAITATGEDIDNDHADQRPVDRSDDADVAHQQPKADEEPVSDPNQQVNEQIPSDT